MVVNYVSKIESHYLSIFLRHYRPNTVTP